MHLLIAAAGSSARMGVGVNKLLLPLLDKPILAWTLAAINAADSVEWVGMMVSRAAYSEYEALLAAYPLRLPVQLILGGATRQESVSRGLAALPPAATHVLIHDGARCLVTPAVIDRCAQALTEHDGIIAAVPVKDTIKEIDPTTQEIRYTPPREKLWAAQTPQGFAVTLLKQAHAQALQEGWSVTDDAALFERLGLPVHLVMGDEANLKVTTPLDLLLAQVILEQRFLT
jgi:2-C-methyl-D-erythritol 4-phosphate cytidylyltransferase